MDSSIDIKLPVGSPSAKCISITRKHTGLSIAEIKKRAADNAPILQCEDIDDEGIGAIMRLYSDLADAGIAPRLYENGRTCTYEFLADTLGFFEWADDNAD